MYKLIIKVSKQLKESKKYRLILKESNTAVGLEGGNYEAQISPDNFLKLTFSQEHDSDVQTRVKKYEEKPFSTREAGKLNLVIDKSGKIDSHEGRARSTMAKKAGISLLPVTIRTKPEGLPWNKIPNTLINQFDDSKTISKDVLVNVKKESYDPSLNIFRLIARYKTGEIKFYSGVYNLQKIKNKRSSYPQAIYIDKKSDLPPYTEDSEKEYFQVARFSTPDEKMHLELDKYKAGDFEILDNSQLKELGLK